MIVGTVLFTYLLNRIVLDFKVSKFMVFWTLFIFLFYLLKVDFMHTNTSLYTNFYNNFVSKELCLTNGMAGIKHCFERENKCTLFHKNFDFLKNAVRNFNFILGFTIFTLIPIIRRSFKNKCRLNFPFY